MARWYVRFDTKSIESLDNDYFNIKNSGNITNFIGYSSASGALYRDGLIASRSLLEADVYQDLDLVNRNAGLGIFFPSDARTSSIALNYVSWSSAYSSSIEGIIDPNTNVYGNVFYDQSVNYSRRPTASVSYTASNVAAPTTPLDPIGVSYQTYSTASQAVYEVLTKILGGGPYSRLGNNPNRTILSVWHDPGLNYFAWDDFTPGQPTVNARSFYSGNTGTTSTGHIVLALTASGDYKNDVNPAGTVNIVASLVFASSSGQQFTGINSVHKSLNTTVGFGDLTSSANPNAFSYRWNAGTLTENTGTLIDAQSSNGLQLNLSVKFIDPILANSSGSAGTVVKNDGSTFVVNGQSITNGAFILIGND